ncbi:MAG TPA: HEAT repeat domain-containing protein [Pirellulales bacterium]|nr:HEAT repeat domain-containing protein [Pirellulales bacterium]
MMFETARLSTCFAAVSTMLMWSVTLNAAEPVYQGRTLNSWLEDLAYGRYPDMEKDRLATEAIRAIGADALPLLIKRFQVPPHLTEEMAEQMDDYQALSQSLSALRILGDRASPAIPALIERLAPARRATSLSGPLALRLGRRTTFAALALSEIGEKSVAPLIAALSAEEVDTRFGAAMALEYFKKYADRAVPALIKAMADSDKDVRWRAARSLGCQRSLPKLSLPALAKLLREDPEANVRIYAIGAIEKFGSEAEIALADLSAATRDTNSVVRDSARTALAHLQAGE